LGKILRGVDVCRSALAGYFFYQFWVKTHQGAYPSIGGLIEGRKQIPQGMMNTHGVTSVALISGYSKR
jgi:hypothetical protein